MSDEPLFERYKNEVRARLSLRELVEEAKPKHLRATGASSLICCSPLRPDKHPSFSVFEGGGGEYVAFDHATRESFDLYAFIEQREGLAFAEAVKWAGERVGLPWDAYKREHGEAGHAPPPPGISQEEWDKARDKVLALDERQLVANMQQAMVDIAHGIFLSTKLPAYVEERWGISPDTQKQFMLGFIPHGFAHLLEDLHEREAFPYSRSKLIKTGWFVPRARVPGDPDPELRCIFDGRLLYPYLFRGKCRYAAARIIYEQTIEDSYWETHSWERAKFKKALVAGPSHPSVSTYVQNDILYNADNLYRSRSGFKRIVIVEGPSDCMTMVEHGYDCVAPVTTSVRVEDIPVLVESVAKYEEVVLATDTDVTPDGRRPGLEGALRMAPALLRGGRRVRLLVLPLAKGQTKMDPAAWALQWKQAGKLGNPFEELMTSLPTVAGALVQFLDPDTTAAQLPEALTPIVKLARDARCSRAEMEEIARLTRKRLKDNFTKTAILQAMGEVGERIDKAEKPIESDDEIQTLGLEGAVIERGGFDEPDRTCCYETMTKTGPVVISNFILQPERIIVSRSGEEMLEVSVYTDLGKKLVHRWMVPSSAWVSKREFKSAFSAVTLGMSFSGSEDNVQGIRKLVAERAARLNVPRIRSESVIGLHETHAGLRLVLVEETWDEHGPMANPDIIYVPEEAPPPLARTIKTDGAQDPADVDAFVKRAVELIFSLNDPVKITTICAWVLGCYFLPQIREMNGGKASILNVFGSPGSGKTTLMHKVINMTLLPFGSSYEPTRPAQTKFPTMELLSWANIFCAPFDEFRQAEAHSSFDGLLRTGFSGGSESRGRSGMTSRGFSLLGAAQVSGEQRLSIDTAMCERLIMVCLDRTTIERRDTSCLHEVLGMDERWRVATDILQWRMKIPREAITEWWSQSAATARAAIEEAKLKGTTLRALDTCVEMAFRMRVLGEWLSWRAQQRVINVELAPLDQVLRKIFETRDELPDGGSSASKSLIAHALERASDYAISGAFQEGHGWRVCLKNDRRMLVVHPGVMAIVLAREEHSRGRPDPTNGLSALRQSAKEEYERGGDMGWLVNPSFPYRMGSKDDIGGHSGETVRSRCWLIDIAKAYEQAGLLLDWPGEVATWGGHKKKSPPPPPGTIGLWKRTSMDVIAEGADE
jgi:DNA primase